MSLVNKLSYKRQKKRRIEKLWRRSLAWLLAVCICLGNVNVAAFAAETSGIGTMGATPSNAVKEGNTATPSNADGAASEIWLPDGTMTGEELLAEAERAVTNEFRFDFNNLMKMIDIEDSEEEVDGTTVSNTERYEKLFKGYENFTLFYDNGKSGRIGDDEQAYAYIVIRVPKETYHSYLSGDNSNRIATASNADATEGGYKLSGDEDIVFLYVNASEQDVSFYLNLENVEAGEVTVPNADAIWEEPEKTESSLPAEGGINTSGAETIDPAAPSEPGGNKVEIDPAAPAPDRNEAAGDGGGNSGAQIDGSTQESETANTDSSQTSEIETEDNQTNHTDVTGSENGTETSENETSADNEEISGTVETSESKETAGTVETSESKETAETSGDKGEAVNTETKGNEEAAAFSETAGSDSASVDTGKSDENTEAPVESEVTLSSSRHNVFTLMEPYTDEEEMDSSDDEMTFEEWQAMIGDDEEEYEYDDREEAVYDEEEGVIYLNLNVLPATVAEVKKEAPKRNVFARMFFAAPETLERAALQAGVANVMSLVPKINGAHKQIEHLGGDDYRLHLDVAGGKQAVDIVLVVDLSNSMDKNSRLTNLKDTIIGKKDWWGNRDGGFVKAVLGPNGNSNSRFSIVTYGTYGAVRTIENENENIWSSNQANIVKTIEGLKVNKEAGGTNYEAGLWHAKESLEQRGTTDNIPYVIFLSDGKPTYYNKSSNSSKRVEFNDISSDIKKNVGGTGNSTDEDTEEETVNAAKEFYKLASDKNVNIYSVAFGLEEEKGKDNLRFLKTIAYGTEKPNDTSRVMTSGNDLTSVFKSILEELEFKNVTISDTLSEYVELPGESIDSAEVKVEEHKKDGTAAEVPSRDYILKYDKGSKTITLKFSEDKVLSDTSVYELSFNIKLTSHAYEEYSASGYGTTVGDEDTDYGNNITSSGMPGFYSNDEAFVSFGEKGTSKIIYPKPVVQVPYEPEYQKYIKDNSDGTYDLTLNVKSTIESTSSTTTEKIPADIVFVLDESASMAESMTGDSKPDEGKSRMELVNAAMESLIKNLGQKGCDVRYAGVQFYGKGYVGNYYGGVDQVLPGKWDNDWPSVENGYRKELNINNPVLGTYPDLGLQAGVNLLKSGSKAHNGAENLKRYIILLTDGDPTESDEKKNATGSKKQLQELNKLNNVTFFSIGYSTDALAKNGYLSVIKKYMEEFTPNIKTNFLSAAVEGETNKVFEAIEREIINTLNENTYGVTGVTITDELSDYADFITSDQSNVMIAVDGRPMTASEYEKAISSVSIIERTAEAPPKIIIRFKPDYELKKDAVYSVTFGVKPTDKAYQDYAENSAVNPDNPYGGVTGDQGTDAPHNDTSSGKPGFHTNAEATLKYTWGTVQRTLEYDHPVLQVKRGKVRIQKIVDNHEGALNDGDQFLIHVSDENGVYASVVLGVGEVSPYIYTEGLLTLSVSESVPMEYRQADQFIKVRKNGETSVPITGNEVTIGPGDDLVIEVHNVFGHKPYFHSEDLIINHTTGNPEIPFTNATENSGNYLLEQVAAAVDPGKRGIEFRELGEDDALV